MATHVELTCTLPVVAVMLPSRDALAGPEPEGGELNTAAARTDARRPTRHEAPVSRREQMTASDGWSHDTNILRPVSIEF